MIWWFREGGECSTVVVWLEVGLVWLFWFSWFALLWFGSGLVLSCFHLKMSSLAKLSSLLVPFFLPKIHDFFPFSW